MPNNINLDYKPLIKLNVANHCFNFIQKNYFHYRYSHLHKLLTITIITTNITTIVVTHSKTINFIDFTIIPTNIVNSIFVIIFFILPPPTLFSILRYL